MARSMSPPVRPLIDDTIPMTCTIESAQLVEGHGEYSIRVSRVSNDSSRSWVIRKRFKEFDDFNNILKEYGFDFELPKKKVLGNTDRTFMAERQKGLQLYLDALVQQLELSNSLAVQRFLDPDNHITSYAESALQYVSMFNRSANNVYQIIEQLPDLGWRYNKTYFLATKNGVSKDTRYLLSWCNYGLDKTFGEKDVSHCLKILKSITHQLVVPLDEVYANESGTLTVCQYYAKGSLKDSLHITRPNNGPYWKRYSRKTPSQTFELSQIKNIGRQILQALSFIYDNGLVYGHLHSGNILFDNGQIRLLDIANAITGVSSKYRCYVSNMKHIRTLEHCDVYAFGRVLYELAAGEECPTSTCMQFPPKVPQPVQQIILKIFASTGDLPTIQQLLDDPFFQTAINNIERFQLKLSPKAKEAFQQIGRTAQARLEGDQAKIKNVQRLNKVAGHHMSEEEKLKRRREKQLRAQAGQNSDPNLNHSVTRNPLQRSVNVDPLQLSAGQTSPKRPLTPILSVDVSNIPQTPVSPAPRPAPVAVAPPPPPPPPPPAASAATGERTQLLSSISDFSHAKLKKTKTNDRSAPKFK